MSDLTASGLPIVIACPASEAYPHEDYQSKHADDGVERHAARERAVNAGDMSVLPDELLDILQPGDKFLTELAVSYDAASGVGRELGQNRHRNYGPMEPFEVPGTIDLLILSINDAGVYTRAIVVDYKGFQQRDYMAQVSLYAIAVAAIYGLDEVTVVVAHEGYVRPIIATLDAADLGMFGLQLRELHVTVALAKQSPVKYLAMGSHCDYCKAFLHCPEQNRLAHELASGVAGTRVDMTLPLGDEQSAADAYDFADRIRLLLRRLDAAIYSRAAQQPIRLNSGKMLGKVHKPGNRKLDGNIAYQVVTAKHGQAIADKAVERVASQSGIENALRAIAPARKAHGDARRRRRRD